MAAKPNGFATAPAIFGNPTMFATFVTPVTSATVVAALAAVLATVLAAVTPGFIIFCATFVAPPTTSDATPAAFTAVLKSLLTPPTIAPGLEKASST